MTISNMPLKGMNDWYGKEFAIRHHIFTVWRYVCTLYGYTEYLTPVLESADLYRAKSGDDVGGKELMTMVDRGGRELALRPEMTPSVTRLISRIYNQESKPLRYFSIANFIRNEKPQRGRNREFWQLNIDIFGENSLLADIEIMQIALDILLQFNPPKDSFVLCINNRQLINAFLINIVHLSSDLHTEVIRLMDKYLKLPANIFLEELQKKGLSAEQSEQILDFMKLETMDALENRFPSLTHHEAVQDIRYILSHMEERGFGEYIVFSPSVLRGFDYYDGIVFEVFDKHPENNRSMFGGGRYNALASIFGMAPFPSVGCAPGDEPLYLFLESWGLVDPLLEKLQVGHVYIPLLEENLSEKVALLASFIRKQNIPVDQGLAPVQMRKAFQYADKTNASFVVIYGSDEEARSEVTIKNMKTAEQEHIPFASVPTYFL